AALRRYRFRLRAGEGAVGAWVGLPSVPRGLELRSPWGLERAVSARPNKRQRRGARRTKGNTSGVGVHSGESPARNHEKRVRLAIASWVLRLGRIGRPRSPRRRRRSFADARQVVANLSAPV